MEVSESRRTLAARLMAQQEALKQEQLEAEREIQNLRDIGISTGLLSGDKFAQVLRDSEVSTGERSVEPLSRQGLINSTRRVSDKLASIMERMRLVAQEALDMATLVAEEYQQQASSDGAGPSLVVAESAPDSNNSSVGQ